MPSTFLEAVHTGRSSFYRSKCFFFVEFCRFSVTSVDRLFCFFLAKNDASCYDLFVTATPEQLRSGKEIKFTRRGSSWIKEQAC
jgi:hypothetical protein